LLPLLIGEIARDRGGAERELIEPRRRLRLDVQGVQTLGVQQAREPERRLELRPRER
jgi:hypothetical protein